MSNLTSLNQNRDFVRLYKRGKSQVNPLLVTYLSKNRQGETRVGITATKKVGGAVERNRAKRVIRAAMRTLPEGLPVGYDIIFVARGRTTACKMQQVRTVMAQHLSRLIAPPPPKQK
ncbi:MAG: ribonuclease P protein component [Angelakisella sp.]